MTTRDDQAARPLIAIINTAQEVIELLQNLFDDEGFATVSIYVPDIKRGRQDLRAFFQEHRPQAVVYDIAIPYVENWQFFQEHVLALGLLPEHCFILTTTNRTVLEMLVGTTTSAIEMIGRPYDLETIVQAVRCAIAHNDPMAAP
jgi:DNA-binding NtrC family response regulator